MKGKIICPHCKDEIKELFEERMVWGKQKCKIIDGSLDYFGKTEIDGDADENGDNLHFYCGKCGAEITDVGTYTEAQEFLLGNYTPKQ